MKWYVVCTKQNSEIKVAESLNSIGINAYCPVFKDIKQYSDRVKKIYKPLLRSYVLVNISEKDRSKVFLIPNVKRYLFWLGKPAIVRNEEVDIIKKNLLSLNSIQINSKLNIGNDFAIPHGPFKGQTGEILSFSNNRLKLQLENIGLFLTVNLSK